MRIPIVFSIFLKDVVDAMRDSRILVSLLTPLLLAILYNSIFPEERLFEAKVAYAGPETSALVRTLEERAGQTVSLKLQHVDTEAEARGLVMSQDVDVAFVLPADVDDAIRQGRRPTIALIQTSEGSAAANFVSTSLEAGIRAVAGQPPFATVRVERVQAGSAEAGVMGELGARRYFVLATVVMMLGMIAVLAVPIILTEEAEKKTLDALLLVANYREVIAAKALVGIAYSAISVALMLALTRLQPSDPDVRRRDRPARGLADRGRSAARRRLQNCEPGLHLVEHRAAPDHRTTLCRRPSDARRAGSRAARVPHVPGDAHHDQRPGRPAAVR